MLKRSLKLTIKNGEGSSVSFEPHNGPVYEVDISTTIDGQTLTTVTVTRSDLMDALRELDNYYNGGGT